MLGKSIWDDIRQIFRRGDNAVHQIIVINVVVFIAVNLIKLITFLFSIDEIIYESVVRALAVPADVRQLLIRPWTVVSYMFLHEGFFHILFNMLWLYWLGNILREFIGNSKIFPVYLLGGIFGAALYILSFNIFPVFQNAITYSYALGASAGVLAVIIAAATLLPDYTIFLLFIGPVKLKYIALISILLDMVSIPSGNAGGHIAHLGGACFGFLFIRQLQRGSDWSIPANRFFGFIKNIFKSNTGTGHKQTFSRPKKTGKKAVDTDKQAKIDAILDKIAQSGYDALSQEEKEFLFRASKEED